MYNSLIIGTCIIAVALGFMIYIIFRSRKTINFIQKKNLKTAREIDKSLHEKR